MSTLQFREISKCPRSQWVTGLGSRVYQTPKPCFFILRSALSLSFLSLVSDCCSSGHVTQLWPKWEKECLLGASGQRFATKKPRKWCFLFASGPHWVPEWCLEFLCLYCNLQGTWSKDKLTQGQHCSGDTEKVWSLMTSLSHEIHPLESLPYH